ncbi:MAG: cytochrome c [Hyphomicrobiales bacterium]|nr:cytochrome c [Hyphomicrobiales bacterium]
MSLIRPTYLLGALFALTATNVCADDPAKGKVLAQEWCTRCHNIKPSGPFKQYPPSFTSIAVYRSSKQIYGRIMFPPLHSNMPEISYVLTPGNVDNLVAYIMSLETQ